jgi:gamma-glutamylcyclotransferase (GGCT)/AIG2-like uncharacterized protein YtfP
MKDYLFVYGTLLPGRAPNVLRGIVEQLVSLGAATMPGRLYDFGRFPGAVFDEATQSRVLGHVYGLPPGDEILATLDRYEDFDPQHPAASLFVRKRRRIQLGDGSDLSCWVYLYNRDPSGARIIPSGDYATWTQSFSP